MKNYLLAVCGLTPQVITETLYALHQEGKRVDAIRILTTRDGKDQCISSLFGAQDGQYFKYLEEYGYKKDTIDFAPRHVIGISDDNGREINDIADELDNELFLSACMHRTFELTRDPDSAVYFSLAGGRKTMSACLSLAAQCYGRAQDRIYHVLVSPEFESNREFFYPPRVSRLIQLKSFRDGQPYHKETRYAKIMLVPMPFFPLRDQLTEKVLKGPEEPATLMLSAIREKNHELVIDLKEGKISWKGIECDLPAARLAIYAFYADCKIDYLSGRKELPGQTDYFISRRQLLENNEKLVSFYRRITFRELPERSKGIKDMDDDNLRGYLSRINSEIRKCFGRFESDDLIIDSIGKVPTTDGIRLPAGQIRIIS